MDFKQQMANNLIADIECFMKMTGATYQAAKAEALNYSTAGSAVWEIVDNHFSNTKSEVIKWGKPDYSGVNSKCGNWYLQASRDIHDKPISWSIFDHRDGKTTEWLDDRIGEVDTLAEAKKFAQSVNDGASFVNYD